MTLIFHMIVFLDWALAKLFYIPIEIVWFFVGHWFTLVQWAEEELKDASNQTPHS